MTFGDPFEDSGVEVAGGGRVGSWTLLKLTCWVYANMQHAAWFGFRVQGEGGCATGFA